MTCMQTLRHNKRRTSLCLPFYSAWTYVFFWTLALLALLWAAISVICITIWRYFENPTFFVQLESKQAVRSFPSVLLFPEIYFPDHKMDLFMSEINFSSTMNTTYIRQVLHQLAAFYSPDMSYTIKDLEILQEVLDYNGIDVDTAARRLTASCEETLLRCRWFQHTVNCSAIFQMELTGNGYCCVFNGQSLRREMKEYGIHRAKSTIRWTTSHVGHTSGLMIVVNQSQSTNDIDLTYKWSSGSHLLTPSSDQLNDTIILHCHPVLSYIQGFKSLAHRELALGGQSYVDSSINGTPLSPGTEQWAGYGSTGFSIADDARSLSDELRHCRLSQEPLKYFPIYNKRYCLLECEIQRTMERCQCVRTAHPLPPGAPYCQARSLRCAKHAAVAYGTEECKCPQTCDLDLDVLYMDTFDLMANTNPHDNFYKDLDMKEVTVVRVYIHNHQSKVFARRSYYDAINLFSQLGGVFNLFFGCSLLTLLEIVHLVWQSLRARRMLYSKLTDLRREFASSRKRKNKKTRFTKTTASEKKI